jgi:hypothetical protein
MKDAVERARLGNADRLAALERLDAEARRLEGCVEDVEFEALVADERQKSAFSGGMTVGGPVRRTR